MTTHEAILRVLRNGRERTTSEIAERLREDYGIDKSPIGIANVLRNVPGVVSTGHIECKQGPKLRTWKLKA